MAVLYNIGNVLTDADELAEKAHIGNLFSFLKAAAAGEDQSLSFRAGNIRSLSLRDNSRLGLPDFTQPGIGKPLSVEILSVYTGDAPQKFFGGKKDLLVVSGVKSAQTYGRAPKALNQMVEKIEDFQYLQPGAFTQGSPIVYYSPAVDVSTTLCSFELVADSFNRDIFDMIGRLFSSAAGLPIFAPLNGYLIVGGALVKTSGKIGNAIFESAAFLREDIAFRFETPDLPMVQAKQMVICNDRDKHKFMGYEPGLTSEIGGNRRPVLLSKQTGKAYRGDAPYIMISIDGRKRDALQGFTPKLASAAMIEKFYGSSLEVQEIDILEEAMMLYNDFHYYKKAKQLEESLLPPDGGRINTNSVAFTKSQRLLNAYVKNIQAQVFRSGLSIIDLLED
ncbi:MAG: hypothetical protein AAGI23_07285 [Bacteroidota bacterium]